MHALIEFVGEYPQLIDVPACRIEPLLAEFARRVERSEELMVGLSELVHRDHRILVEITDLLGLATNRCRVRHNELTE